MTAPIESPPRRLGLPAGPLGRHSAVALAGIALAVTLAGPARADTVQVDCVVEAADKVKVGSATTGVLRQVLVARGDEVRAGQIIAQLDTSVEEANLALAVTQANSTDAIEAQRLRMELYRKRLDRNAQLTKGIVTQERMDQVEADYEIGRRDLQTEIHKHGMAGLELKRAQAMLDQRVIRSTVGGIVSEKLLSAGEFVRQDSPIFTIVQLDPLYVEAYMPVANWSRIAVGMTGRVRLEDPIGGEHKAKVTVVDRTFDAASGTFGLRLELPNAGDKLPSGQRCKLAIELQGGVNVAGGATR